MKVVRMSQVVDTVSDLVQLRRWTLSVLQVAPGRDAAVPAAAFPAVSPQGLPIFLSAERCAAPLAECLARARTSARIPLDAIATIESTAMDDANHVLRAEREAREIGTLLSAQDQSAIVLKGGVAAVLRASPPVTLHDVDLLVTTGARKHLEQILDARGFTAADADEAHHRCWYPPAGHLPVEIHWTTHNDGQPENPAVWRRAIPLGTAPGLEMLDWSDQVIHLIRHAIEHHNDRHVTIRDLFLTGWVASHLSQEELESIRKAIETSRDPQRSNAFLDFSRAVYTGQRMSDPFENDAILHFAAAVLLQQGPLWSGGPSPVWHNAAAVAAGVMSVSQLVSFAGRNPVTGIDAFQAFQRRAPSVGALLTRSARAAHYFGSTLIGVPLLRTIRSRVHKRLANPLS